MPVLHTRVSRCQTATRPAAHRGADPPSRRRATLHGTRLVERGFGILTITSMCSQEINPNCSRNRLPGLSAFPQKFVYGSARRPLTSPYGHRAHGAAEIAPELTGHGLPLSKCEAYNRVYDQFYQSR